MIQVAVPNNRVVCLGDISRIQPDLGSGRKSVHEGIEEQDETIDIQSVGRASKPVQCHSQLIVSGGNMLFFISIVGADSVRNLSRA